MKPLLSIILAGVFALGVSAGMKTKATTWPIVNTVDSLQFVSDFLLRQKLMEKEAEWGCVILMDVKSNEIKALSNFDRNEDGTYSMQKNHADECMEAGTIMSIYDLTFQLEDGKVRFNDTCPVDSIILKRFGRNLTVRQAFVSGALPDNKGRWFTPLGIVGFYKSVANGNELIKMGICGEPVLREIRSALHDVVWDNEYGPASVNPWGTRKAQSDIVHIAGKTGSVRIYKDDNRKHRISFVGYFPEENPEYTCLCIIHYPKKYYDAGTDCGVLVRKLAEYIYSPKQ